MESMKGRAMEKDKRVCMAGNRINYKPPPQKKQIKSSLFSIKEATELKFFKKSITFKVTKLEMETIPVVARGEGHGQGTAIKW